VEILFARTGYTLFAPLLFLLLLPHHTGATWELKTYTRSSFFWCSFLKQLISQTARPAGNQIAPNWASPPPRALGGAVVWSCGGGASASDLRAGRSGVVALWRSVRLTRVGAPSRRCPEQAHQHQHEAVR
jgi:hypothetical protein